MHSLHPSVYKARVGDINNITLSVPFTNLSLVGESEIAVKRMRPLILRDIGVNNATEFTINARTSFHHGRSENPTIGTI